MADVSSTPLTDAVVASRQRPNWALFFIVLIAGIAAIVFVFWYYLEAAPAELVNKARSESAKANVTFAPGCKFIYNPTTGKAESRNAQGQLCPAFVNPAALELRPSTRST